MIDISRIRPEFRSMVDEWLERIPWVHAIGIGPKRVAGRFIEHESITFFVTTKLPPGKVDQLVPKWITFRGLDSAVPTDIIEMPPLTFSCSSNRPAHGGDCIAPRGAPWVGTLGAALSHKETGEMFILSASHTMLGIGGILSPKQLICHPIGSSAPIASVSQSTVWSTSAPMKGDVAFAKVLNKNHVDSTVNGIGTLSGLAAPVLGNAVRFSGRNGQQFGQLVYVDVTVRVNNAYRFENTFLITALAQKGDSGSIAVDPTKHALGVVFADNGFLTACTDLTAPDVKSELNLDDYQF